MSWDAADAYAIIVGQPSVSEVLMRCRAVKAAAAAGDSACVAAWGKSCVKLAGNVMGSDSEALRLMRMWVSGILFLFIGLVPAVVQLFEAFLQVQEAVSVLDGRGQWSSA